MIQNNDSFVIDDDFDPLADIDLDEYDQDGDADYMVPIPDADKSVVPPKVEAPAPERIEKLISGMPGQLFRLLAAVDACREPLTLDAAAASVDERCPQGASVFEAPQIVLLMERAGALEKIEPEGEGVGEAAEVVEAAEGDSPAESADRLEVTPAAPATYVATEAGLAALEKYSGEHVIISLIDEMPRYKPIYQRILSMCNVEGGTPVGPLNKAIDSDELLQEPRLFCTYFLNKLEGAGALVWRDNWKITEAGKSVLTSNVFAK